MVLGSGSGKKEIMNSTTPLGKKQKHPSVSPDKLLEQKVMVGSGSGKWKILNSPTPQAKKQVSPDKLLEQKVLVGSGSGKWKILNSPTPQAMKQVSPVKLSEPKVLVGSGSGKKKILNSTTPLTKKQKRPSVSPAKLLKLVNDLSELSTQKAEVSNSQLRLLVKTILTPEQNRKCSKRESGELNVEMKRLESSAERNSSSRMSSSKRQSAQEYETRDTDDEEEEEFEVSSECEEVIDGTAEEEKDAEEKTNSSMDEKVLPAVNQEIKCGVVEQGSVKETVKREEEKRGKTEIPNGRSVQNQTDECTLSKIGKRKRKSHSKTRFLVYITNVHVMATEEDVREHFREVSIKSIDMKKKWKTETFYGHILMELEDFASYVKALTKNKTCVNGRPLRVVPDRRMPYGLCKVMETIDNENIYKVCVSKLPSFLSQQEVKEYFMSVGTIKSFVMPFLEQKPGEPLSLVLELDDKKVYEKVLKMNGSLLHDQPILVEPLPYPGRNKTSKRMADGLEGPPLSTRLGADGLEGDPQRKSLEADVLEVDPDSKMLEFDDLEELPVSTRLGADGLEVDPDSRMLEGDDLEGDPQSKKVEAASSQDDDQASGKDQFAFLVTSIPLTVTRAMLIEHFAKAGKVAACKIRNTAQRNTYSSKRALVVMGDEESYKNAWALNGSTLEGQQLILKMLKKHSERREERFVAFVGNFSAKVKPEDIREHFEDVGNILDVTFPMSIDKKPKGHAFVVFGDRTSYQKALTKHRSMMNGQSICVVPYEKNIKILSEDLLQTTDDKNVYKVCVSYPAFLSMQELKQYFISVGTVKRFIIPAMIKRAGQQQSLVLEFDDKEVYEKVLEMNGSLVKDHPIFVDSLSQSPHENETEKRKADSFEDPQSKRLKGASRQAIGKHQFALFIGSIPLTVTQQMLEEHFAKAGKVSQSCLHNPAGDQEHREAYVQMADEEGYKNAFTLQDSTLEGMKLVVEGFKVPSQIGKKKRFTMCIGHIPLTTTDEDIRKHFQDVGKILHVKFPLSSENVPLGYAYVDFKYESSVQKSLTLNDSSMNGRIISVSRANNKIRHSSMNGHSINTSRANPRMWPRHQNPGINRSSMNGDRINMMRGNTNIWSRGQNRRINHNSMNGYMSRANSRTRSGRQNPRYGAVRPQLSNFQASSQNQQLYQQKPVQT